MARPNRKKIVKNKLDRSNPHLQAIYRPERNGGFASVIRSVVFVGGV